VRTELNTKDQVRRLKIPAGEQTRIDGKQFSAITYISRLQYSTSSGHLPQSAVIADRTMYWHVRKWKRVVRVITAQYGVPPDFLPMTTLGVSTRQSYSIRTLTVRKKQITKQQKSRNIIRPLNSNIWDRNLRKITKNL
jgi:hypothetical protein